ncbi:peptidyl-prolyl cis-trans isomerase, FKBP-type [Bacteroides pyogenes F0041]|uniref:Peptidyl-prolyl cis-trans isomerase n=1 Tax=Bacteroides pyogenes F0041 TaxID=1321819 RepID=U2DHI4_9BACE|nr:FKBP-type peptidyl-prolyl cis-trans isomerase [Bacteroides pyogenes]ERI80942.1 peptidyl-prolyl cis-trans isomerase, FKBP-type [Bacteroides pyogenes F0041]MBB3896233.1 FKBP-type peptidyl-prolyl cis-trans isomerase SlyD [Bacteroides pyogenes]SUV30914.1 FKBP-type peptidyl-prolyl cis-trans isomerases 2 [Bacteroides pyogenes]
METAENKYITVAYRLYTMEDGEKELFEEAKADHPFQFISGLGTTLEDFENQITVLSKGDKFNFTIPADKAYGEYDEQHVIELPKHIFEVDGAFDKERVKEGNIVPLMTGDGQQVNANVVEIKEDVVVVDLNHPLAGASLIFEGEVIENRPATNEEIQELVKMMSGDGCGCGSCDDHGCGDGCGCEENSCGCGSDCGCEGSCH